jgi:hypothetical protein
VKALFAASFFLGAAGFAVGQDLADLPSHLASDESIARSIGVESWALESARAADLPADLAAEELFPGSEPAAIVGPGFVLGPMAGFLRARGSDHGAWFGGAVARAYLFPALAAEASISVHQDRFEGGAVRITQWPVQVTGLLFPFAALPVDPYLLAGAGWYYTRVHTRGSFASFKDETDKTFGAHVGAGVELRPQGPFVIFGDVRYIWLRPTTDAVEDSDFSYWQVTLGIGFAF